MNKKLLLVAGATIVVVSAGVTAVAANDQYRQYQSNQAAKEQAVQNAAAAETAKTRALADEQVKRLETWVVQLRVECEKGKAAYATLTPYQKTRVAAPSCAAQ